jgi:hypothetical protein
VVAPAVDAAQEAEAVPRSFGGRHTDCNEARVSRGPTGGW